MKEEDRTRAGKFVLSRLTLVNAPAEDLRQIMGRCVIVRAESRYSDGSIEYDAYSPYFDIVPEATTTPTYEWVFGAGGWTPRRTDTYSINDVRKMIGDAVKAVPTRVIIKQMGRGWKRCR